MNRTERAGRAAADNAALPDGDLIAVDANAAMTAQAQKPPLEPREVRTIMLCLMLTMFLAALDQTIVATALPTIGRQFHDVTNLSWVITAYLLSSTAVAPLFGSLSDIYGRRNMIVVSVVLFLVGSVMCAMAPNMIMLILARAVQGLGGGGIMPIVQTIIADVVTPKERGQYQAYFSAVWVSAGIGGPILGGVFAEHLHWSVIFWINLPLGIAALVLLIPRMNRIPSHHRKRKVDWAGGVLLMSSAVVLMLVLTWGGTRFSWLSPTILAMIGSALALALLFGWRALNTDEPFLPLGLMGGSVVPYAMAAGGCALGAMVGLTVHLPLYYDVVYHLTASEAGLALIPIAATSVLGAALAGRGMGRTKHYKRIAIFGSATGAIIAAILAIVTPLPLWLLLVALALMAIGLGTVFPVTVVSTQNAVLRTQIGTVTGALNFFRALMTSFTVAAFTTIMLMSLGTNISISGEHASATSPIAVADMVNGFRYVFAAAAVLLGLASVCLMVMEERPLEGPVEASVVAE